MCGDASTTVERVMEALKKITFYVPGMFRYAGMTGAYDAVSITGNRCELQCDHCRGKLLQSMFPAATNEALIRRCATLYEKGNPGVLLTGGCNSRGELPWSRFLPAIREIKQKTRLHISIHGGMMDDRTAHELKTAGVDQVLIDVVGEDDTLKQVCHAPYGVSRIVKTLESLNRAGLEVAPHIVCGLHFGKLKGEKKAVDLLSRFAVRRIIIVSLMRLPGTPSMRFRKPTAEEVGDVIAYTRSALPKSVISLGCARERGNRKMEILAIEAGVDRMALPSDEAVAYAGNAGCRIGFQPTCCSVPDDL
ncbi:MAG: radical SAM protein [Desulfobacterales bacterium]